MNNLVEVKNGKILIASDFTKEYAKFQKEVLEMDLKIKEIKEKVKEKMEENNILTFEDDYIKMVYKKPSIRTTVDSKRLKTECPDIYEEYSKTSNVKSSITVEIK